MDRQRVKRTVCCRTGEMPVRHTAHRRDAVRLVSHTATTMGGDDLKGRGRDQEQEGKKTQSKKQKNKSKSQRKVEQMSVRRPCCVGFFYLRLGLLGWRRCGDCCGASPPAARASPLPLPAPLS